MRKKLRYTVFFTVAFFSLNVACFGQTHDLPPPELQAVEIPPPYGLPVPIDDYLPLLLIAGAVYGAYYKLRKTAKT